MNTTDEKAFITLRLKKRTLLTIGVTLLILASCLFLLKPFVVDWLAQWLTISDPLVKCDIIFVLGGKAERRIPYAISLYKEDYGKKLVLTMGKQDDWVIEALERYGVEPIDYTLAKAIVKTEHIRTDEMILLKESYSTLDDAKKLRAYYDREKFNSALVVTDPLHSRRALLCLRWCFAGTEVSFLSHPVPLKGFAERFTHHDDYVNYVIEETLRLSYYSIGLKKHE
ncbi:MAG: YdcF family protein [Vulcanimicrobiota bacterium]